jgi:hypothetical protein
MSILRLDGFRIIRSSKSVTSVCGVELYVCVYLVYVCVDEVRVCSFSVIYV